MTKRSILSSTMTGLVPVMLMCATGIALANDALDYLSDEGATEDASAAKAGAKSGAKSGKVAAPAQKAKLDSKSIQIQGNSEWSVLLKDVAAPTEPLQKELLTAARSAKLPYEARAWVVKILKGELAGAAHLWTAVEPKFTDGFRPTARVAQAWLLWKLDLSQTFIDRWVDLARQPSIANTKIFSALTRQVEGGFDAFAMDRAIVVPSDLRSSVEGLDPKVSPIIVTTLKAMLRLRNPSAATAYLNQVPDDNRWKIPLARTVALAQFKAGQVTQGSRILKKELVPAIEANNDAHALANHYLQLGRLLYQAGAMEAAEQYYRKVPSGSSDYLTAREELLWVYLRQNDISKLRGEVASLSQAVYESGRFEPEVALIRAISNLKLCYYDRVEKDFDAFIQVNKTWAQKVSAAMKASDPETPPRSDFYSQWMERAVKARAEEMVKLEALAQESIQAVLPAVGIQSHWKDAMERMRRASTATQQARVAENRRIWKGMAGELNEAIRKMKFVKIEYMTQVEQYSQAQAQKAAAAGNADELKMSASARKLETKDDEIVFKFDGTYWPDEMFQLRSAAQAKCLEALNGQK